MDGNKCADNHWFLIAKTQKIGMSLVAASEDDTSNQNGKPSTPHHLTSSTSIIFTTRQNLHLAIMLVLKMYYLPRDQLFCLGLKRTAFFPFIIVFLSLNMSEHASFLYFIYLSFLHPNVLPKAQQSYLPTHFWSPGWRTICWLYYLPRHQPLCFGLNRDCIFTSSLFTILSFNMSTHVHFPWFICHFSILVYYKRLSRAIHPHNFSCPAEAQFAHCITCLSTGHFDLFWARNCLSARSLVSHIYTHSLVWICLNMFRFISCFMSAIW